MSLVISDLSKSYPNGVKALSQFSLTIEKGMFGLLGPNGAGKSTLMRTIATLQIPDQGSIHYNDIDVLASPIELRKILGYLPQDFGVFQRESADRLLNYLAILKGISNKREREQIIDYALSVTNLTEVRRKSVSGYSGGMKQRFGIAQLLLNNPQLIIVDEPTAGLDPEERNRFLNILREIGTKSTVIFSTHIVEDIRELCTDMAIMNRGELILQSAPQRAREEIDGSVWVKNIAADEIEAYKNQFEVLSSSFNPDDSVQIRVHHKHQPNESFSHTIPKLEDVYFIALRAPQVAL